jgi:hypothetical protein
MMMLIVREHGPNDTLAMLLVAYLLLPSYVPSELRNQGLLVRAHHYSNITTDVYDLIELRSHGRSQGIDLTL